MLELGLALERLGHEVTVACHDFEPGTEYSSGVGQLTIRSVQWGRIEFPPTRAAWFRRQWVGMGQVARLVPPEADVINAHEWPAVHAAVRAGRRSGAPVVWSRNDETIFERALMPNQVINAQTSPLRRLVDLAAGLADRLAARHAARVAVLDERNAALVRRAFGVDPVIVRSGPAAHFFEPPERSGARRRVGVDNRHFLVLAVGILLPHRRFEDLIDAVALLADERLRAHIVGSDHRDPHYGQALRRRVASVGVQDAVVLHAAGVEEPQLRDLYAAADVFVLPDRLQAYGLAPLEALAAGTPVIVSSGAGVLEVLRERDGVTVVPPGRPDAIAAALRNHLRDGRRGGVADTRAWLSTTLSNDRYAARMLEVFEDAVAAKRN
jgi:glycosyltransferase involved in cell wall biosynthesis